MDDLYTKEQRVIHDATRAFATERLAPNAAQWDRDGTLPGEVIREMGELGLLGVIMPAEWDGSYTDYVAYTLALEEVTTRCTASATVVSMHNSMGCGSILRFSTETRKARYLSDPATGRAIGAFCLTKPHAGSEANNLHTHAVLRDGKWMFTGNKQFVTNGICVDIAVVLTVTDPDTGRRDISAFIVPTGTPGLHVGRPEHKLGIYAPDTCPIALEDCAVPEENLLSERGEGLKIALSNLEGRRIGIVAQTVGITCAAFDAAHNYANERIQFSKTLREHQTIANILADMATRLNVARLLIHHAARLRNADKPCLSEASRTKLYASELTREICSNTIQIHGDYGYLADYVAKHHYRDARITQVYEGASEVQRMVIAQHT